VSDISKITSVSRRTLHDSTVHKKKLSPSKLQQVRDDFQIWIDANKDRFPEIENFGKKRSKISKRDDFEAYPWHDYLTLHADLFLNYGCNEKTKSIDMVLPKASMKELRAMEGVDYDFSNLIMAEDFTGSKQLLFENWHTIPLANPLSIEAKNIEAMQSWEPLLLACRQMEFHSLLYILALVDVGIGQGDKPVLADLLPVRKGKQWICPVKRWLISIQNQLGVKTVDEMGLIISEWSEVDPDHDDYGIRNLKRWRSGKHLPLKKHVAIICAHLEPARKYNYSRQYLRFVIARIFQLFHNECCAAGISDDFLENLYATYDDWYAHHRALNRKAPA
jgi:hypothetical protein